MTYRLEWTYSDGQPGHSFHSEFDEAVEAARSRRATAQQLRITDQESGGVTVMMCLETGVYG